MRSIFALLLLVVAASAIAPVFNADSTYAIQGSYIVILKDGLKVADRDAHIADLKSFISSSSDFTSKVNYEYDFPEFVGFGSDLSYNALKYQRTHPNVKYIEVDQLMTTVDTQTGATWGLDRIDQRNLPLASSYSYNSTAGKGATVYVVDTGILTTHVDFGGRASHGYNAITGEGNQDGNGHGTHCAGTIGGTTYGVAKNCKLVAVKVLSASGSGTTQGVIAGVNYVRNNAVKPAIASMSLGGGASPTLVSAVESCIAAGTAFAVAAGNENQNACNVSPANAPNAVTVGATTRTDARASYSNWGTCVDIFAPGSDVTSDWIGSNSAISTISGTSMACPHVAGVLALQLAAYPATTPAQATKWLTAQATPSKVTNPGTGSPNLLLYAPY